MTAVVIILTALLAVMALLFLIAMTGYLEELDRKDHQ